MRFVFIGGTGYVGPAGARAAAEGGHEVVIAHSGQHENVAEFPHVHGEREALLTAGGPVDRAEPDVLVDSFSSGSGGASAAKAEQLLACARRTGARVIAISSGDVYRYSWQAGLDGGAGRTLLVDDPIPVSESAPLREPYPGEPRDHDNVPMERTLAAGVENLDVAVLRLGMVYGPGRYSFREWHLVRRLKAGVLHLDLPYGGGQFFSRVAIDRVGSAIVAAAERAPAGYWPCNVVDPFGWTYAGLAKVIGDVLGFEWQPVFSADTVDNPSLNHLPVSAVTHPFNLGTPGVFADERLRHVLEVVRPDPRDALAQTVEWLWEHGEQAFAGEPWAMGRRVQEPGGSWSVSDDLGDALALPR